jgi:hypothetical protein
MIVHRTCSELDGTSRICVVDHHLYYSPCNLCPDGGTFDATKVIPNMFEPNGPSTNCADLHIDHESFLDHCSGMFNKVTV